MGRNLFVGKDIFCDLYDESPSVNELVDSSFVKDGILHKLVMRILSYLCLDEETMKGFYRSRVNHEVSKSIFPNDTTCLLAEIDALKNSLDEEQDIRIGAQLLIQSDKKITT